MLYCLSKHILKFSKICLATLFLLFICLRVIKIFRLHSKVQVDTVDTNRLELTFTNGCDCRRIEKILIERINFKEYTIRLSYNQNYNIDLNTEKIFRVGCNLNKVLRRGRNQRVVSYSLFAASIKEKEIDAKYTDLLRELAYTIHKYFPDWLIRIYYDGSDSRILKKNLICSLECLTDRVTSKLIDNVDFCDISRLPFDVSGTRDLIGESAKRVWSAKYIHGMIWRWLPIGDSLVHSFMSRDTDSIIIQREIDSIHVWLNSNRSGHIMRGFFSNST